MQTVSNMGQMDFKFNVTGDTGVQAYDAADELDFVPTGSAMQQQTLTDAGTPILSLPEH